jgi:hypothetical protein
MRIKVPGRIIWEDTAESYDKLAEMLASIVGRSVMPRG